MTDLIEHKGKALQLQESNGLNEMKLALTIAQQNPRDEQRAIEAISKSMKRLGFAESAMYSYPRGGTIIQGPSIKFARELSRYWQNLQYGVSSIIDDGENRTVEMFAWDMELNTMIKRKVMFEKKQQRKVWDDKTKKYTTEWVKPDERDLRELTSKMASLEIRNCILSLISSDIVDDLMTQSRLTQVKALSCHGKDQITKALEGAMEAFSKKGITQAHLELIFRASKSQWTGDTLIDMRSLYKACQDGQCTWDSLKTDKTEIRYASMDDFLAGCKKVEKKQ